MSNLWDLVDSALDQAEAAGRTVDVWLRDDDVVTRTPALERLAELSETYALPVLLAVIPEPADGKLADFVGRRPLLTPTQHGFSHTNHARPGERARELGGLRPVPDILDDLARGSHKLELLFGAEKADILVPPWNRIDAGLLPYLPGIGFDAISTFGLEQSATTGLDALNSNLDIIDWRNGRRCHSEPKLVEKLIGLIDAKMPVGLLTHHLAHDETAWMSLDLMLSHLTAHKAVRFRSADALRKLRTPES